MRFSGHAGCHYLKSNNVGHILAKFSAILLEFSTNQNIWGCACTPASDTP